MDADEPLRFLKNLILASLLIAAIWFLTFPAAKDKLTEYRVTRDLHAWLYVRAAVSSLHDQVFNHEPSESIESMLVEVEDPTSRGDAFETAVPLKIHSVWPELREYSFSLAPNELMRRLIEAARQDQDTGVLERYRSFDIIAEQAQVPLSDYAVLFGPKGATWVIPRDAPPLKDPARTDLRFIAHGPRQFEGPKTIQELAIRLARYGYTKSVDQIQLQDSALKSMRLASDPATPDGGVTILGISLSMEVFFSSVGIILLAVAFSMLGPLIRLRRIRDLRTTMSWIAVVLPEGALGRYCLESLIVLLSIAWVLTPLLILVLQTNLDLEHVTGWIIHLGQFCLIATSIVFLVVAFQLRQIRRLNT